MKFFDRFKGTGSMVKFCDETNALFKAFNNIDVIVPSGYSGISPSFNVYEDGMTFDFGDALIFTLKNVRWELRGSAIFVSNSVSVENGKLVIRVTANSAGS